MLSKRAFRGDLFDQFFGNQVPQVAERLATSWTVGESSFAGLADDVAVGALVNWRRIRHLEADRTFQCFFNFGNANHFHFGS